MPTSMKQPHFLHVREHLERVRDGYSYIPDPESVYLGKVEGDHFWELVGLRLQAERAGDRVGEICPRALALRSVQLGFGCAQGVDPID